MQKRYFLAALNVVVAGLLSLLLTQIPLSSLQSLSAEALLSDFGLYLILLATIICNLWLAWNIWRKRLPFSVRLAAVTTVISLSWVVIMFLSGFFASSLTFVLLGVVLATLIYVLLSKHQAQLARILSFVTLGVFGLSFYLNFEEVHCWRQGEQASQAQGEWTIATEQDAQALAEFNVEAGQQISVSFREHMKCHQTFTFGQALKDTYR